MKFLVLFVDIFCQSYLVDQGVLPLEHGTPIKASLRRRKVRKAVLQAVGNSSGVAPLLEGGSIRLMNLRTTTRPPFSGHLLQVW